MERPLLPDEWFAWDVIKPQAEHLDRFGYVLVWSRSAKCAVTANVGTLVKGAHWRPLPKGPQERT